APWSRIWVNGKRFGDTPVAKIPVTTGCATIRAVDARGHSTTKSVTVRPNTVTIVKFSVGSKPKAPGDRRYDGADDGGSFHAAAPLSAARCALRLQFGVHTS